MDPLCPPAVSEVVGGETWHPFPERQLDEDPEPDPGLRWPGAAWEVGQKQVRRAAAAVIAELLDRRAWLNDHLPTFQVVTVDDEWLVASPAGQPAHRPERQPDPDRIPALIGATLRDLHRLEVGSCPYRNDWAVQHGLVAAAVADGRLDVSLLPDPYGRYSPDRLLELVVEGRPREEGSVVCHGAPVVPNLSFEAGHLSGMAGFHRLGVADPHLDLAIAHRSIQSWFGGDAVFGFYQGYEADPDLVVLDHYLLLDVLVAAIDRRSAQLLGGVG